MDGIAAGRNGRLIPGSSGCAGKQLRYAACDSSCSRILRLLHRAAVHAVIAAAGMFGIGLPVAQAVPTPIAVSTNAVNFGAVNVGGTRAITVTVTNTSAVTAFGPINMFGGAPPTPEFNASQSCQGKTLAPGGTCTISYTFTPSGGGAFNDSSNFTISATSSQADGEDFVVGLTGTGVNPITAAPLNHNFGNVNIGSTAAAKTTVITNTGNQPFGPINIFGGAPPTPEFNASQSCQGNTLAPGGTCTIGYTFTPSGGGTFNDSSNFTISATASQAAGVAFSVRLTGCGIPGQACLPPASTVTTVTCTPNPASTGQAVTCIATVTSSGAGTPAGSVAFTVDGNAVANVSLDGAGRGRFTTTSLAPGTHSIVARYSSNSPNLLASTSAPFVQSVADTLTAVEFIHSQWGFYFVTSFAPEISALDGGAFGGVWQRTGQTFPVWERQDPGTSPVCRFFSTSFAPRSSHFYTPFASECETVKGNPDWQYEGVSFYLKTPTEHGSCPVGSAPLYRLYNNGMGGAPNHRYSTSAAVANQMVALGWVPEGFGGAGVQACVPSS